MCAMLWYVVRDRKLIVSGPDPLSEVDARIKVEMWNTLYLDADYEAVSFRRGGASTR